MKVVSHDPSLESAVAAFNLRLKAAGADDYAFSHKHLSSRLPPIPGRKIYVEYFLAVDEHNVVRGGYGLKCQDYKIGMSTRSIGLVTNLMSEAVVDPKYAVVASMLLLHALKREPLLYGLGLGTENEAITRLLRAGKWQISTVPFFFRVIQPYRFLRRIRFLRSSIFRKVIFDLLAFTGLGWLGGALANFILSRHALSFPGVATELVDEFGDWANELWDAYAGQYPYCAVRDCTTLNILYPKCDRRFFRLKIRENGALIGWAVVLATDLRGHKQFGDMRLGSIVDAFAQPAQAEKIVAAADGFLNAQRVDLIVTNQSFREWCDAVRKRGYLSGPSNFLFATSPKLTAMLKELGVSVDLVYVNRGDGDGPINL